jgi:hypothetical protein
VKLASDVGVVLLVSDYRRRGYSEDRARRRLEMERIEPPDADLRWIDSLACDVDVTSLVEELPLPRPLDEERRGRGRPRGRGWRRISGGRSRPE